MVVYKGVSEGRGSQRVSFVSYQDILEVSEKGYLQLCYITMWRVLYHGAVEKGEWGKWKQASP